MTLRALVIAPQPFYSSRGTPLSVYYRNLILSELGVHIDLVTYGQGQDVEIANMSTLRIPRFRYLGDVKIGPSWLKLFLDFFVALRVFAQLLRRRYDFLVAHEEAIVLCRCLKPIFRFKLIYDMHSNLAEQISNMGVSRSRLLQSTLRRVQENCIRNSDVVITICPALAAYVHTVRADPQHQFLIENSIFEDVRLAEAPGRDPGSKSPAAVPAPSLAAGRRVILYAGTLEPYQGIDLLLEAFSQAIQRCRDSVLLIVGGTDGQVEHYGAIAERLGVNNNVLLLGNRSQEQTARYLECATLAVSPRLHGTNTPLKIYQLMASGTPLVATDIESHRQVLDEAVAFLAQPDPASLASAIVLALTEPAEAACRARMAQQLYADKYGRERYVEKVRKVLEAVV